MNPSPLILSLLALGLAAPALTAEEGMWTFDNFPAERMQSELGWAPDQAWLDRAMAGAGRVPDDIPLEALLAERDALLAVMA